MKTALVFVALLFTTAAFSQSNTPSPVDDAQITRSLDSALAQLDSLDKSGELAAKISHAVELAMKNAGGVLAEAQGELRKAQDSHVIDSAVKQSANVISQSKAALKAAAKVLKDSDAIKQAGKAIDEAAKVFETAVQEFEKEFEKEIQK